jgi:exodeoxyribonuclease VII large subunit
MAVPVRLDLLAQSDALGARLSRALAQGFAARRQRAADLARALPRPDSLTGPARQRLDLWADRLPRALVLGVSRRRARLAELAATTRPAALARLTAQARQRLDALAARLDPAMARLTADAARRQQDQRRALAALAARLEAAPATRIAALRERLAARDRLRLTLGPTETLKRGYAIVWADGHVATTRAAAESAATLEVQFHDGRITPGAPRPGKRGKTPPPGQGSLF